MSFSSFKDESGTDKNSLADDKQLAPFEEYKRQFEHLREMDVERRTSLYLLHFEDDSMSILKKVSDPENPDQKSFVDVSDKLQEHFRTNEHLINKRFQFHHTSQKEGQSLEKYLEELQEKARECEFKEFEDEAVCFRFRDGMNNEIIRKRLMAEESNSITAMYNIAKAMEIAMQECKIFSRQSSDIELSDVDDEDEMSETANGVDNDKIVMESPTADLCGRCGKEHRGVCFSKHFGCFNCNLKGHTAKMCPNKTRRLSKILSTEEVSPLVVKKVPGQTMDYKLYLDQVVREELVRTLSRKTMNSSLNNACDMEKALSRQNSASSSRGSPMLTPFKTGGEQQCEKCGEKHEGLICRLKNLRCFYCSFKGHSAKMCPNKNKRFREVEEQDLISDSENDGDDDDEDDEEFDYRANDHEHLYDEHGMRHVCHKCLRQPDFYNTRNSPFRFMRFELPFQTWLPF